MKINVNFYILYLLTVITFNTLIKNYYKGKI